mgnify:CR=1 FL=1
MAEKKTAYINGRIFTSDRENLHADSMAAAGGRLTFVGSRAELPNDDYDEVVDLKGKRVIPGFIDAHMHPVLLADFAKQISCLPPKVNSIKELSEAIAEVRKVQGPDKWILGWGYDEGKLAEHRSPNRYDLDAGSADAPVYIIRSCEHIRCVNSKALEMAGITKDTPDPQGGEIERDENGEPTGVLKENAKYLISPYLPEETREDQIRNLVDLGDLLTSQGIVGICDMGNLTSDADNFDLYEEAVAEGFRQKTAVYYMWDFFENDPEFFIPKYRMDSSRQIHAAGLKLIGDGSVSGRTAWVSEPYAGSTDEFGMPVYSDESMESALSFVKKNHCQLSVHAMGGRAIDRVIDRLANEPEWMENGTPGIRMEHITEPSDEALAKAARRGIAMATQPIFSYCEIETYLKNFGAERTKKAYPYRKIMDAGIRLCLSTDSPATSWAVPSDPFSNLKSAVTRIAYDGTDIGADQRLDMETAVILYTAEAARVSGFDRSGMLKAGYSADFAVLDRDIFDMEPSQIDQTRVECTVIAGEKAFAAE